MQNKEKEIKKIGILGSGVVAKTLAEGFKKHGFDVMMGTRYVDKLKNWTEAGNKAGTFREAGKFGDILVLAVKGSAAENVLGVIDDRDLKDKIIMDTTNPIADEQPVNGVIKFFTELNFSHMEKLQRAYPEAKFVKAFSCVGNAFMVNPDFEDGKPTMFIAGDSDEAKAQVTEILDKFGWEIEDMGKAEGARAIEPLAMLWCIPGFIKNQWNHAFKLLKKKVG